MSGAESSGQFVSRASRNPVSNSCAARAGNLFAKDAHTTRQNGSSNETVAGCSERQFGKVKRKNHSVAHRYEPTSLSPRRVPGKSARALSPKVGGQKRTDRLVCLSSSATVLFRHPKPITSHVDPNQVMFITT